MAFMDELRARSGPLAGNNNVATPQFGPVVHAQQDDDLEPLFHKIRNRNIQDQLALAKGMSDIQLRQDFLRARMTPESVGQKQDTVYKPPPSEQQQNFVSPLDAAKFGLEREKLAANNKSDQARQQLDEKKFGLDQQKNQQIYQVKMDDMERKMNQSQANLELAQKRMEASQGNAAAMAGYREAQIQVAKDRIELQKAQGEANLKEQQRMHEAQIDKMKKDAENAGFEFGELRGQDGTVQQTMMRRRGQNPIKQGNTPGTIRVITPDGQHLDWPENKPLPPGYNHIGQY